MKATSRILTALLVLAFAAPAFAQSLTGAISGTVTDEQGGALPGATVTLASKTGTKTATTETSGTYRFVALEPGTYSVQVELTGFAPRKQQAISVSVSQTFVADFTMKVGGMTDSVDVVGEAPVVDTASSATNNELGQDLLYNMPIRQGNTATNLLNFAPGITDGAAYGGDADNGNGLLIDGVDTRDPSGGTAWTFYNYNIVEEVQFTGIGAPAEYGAFTGAIVNTVTKSGGNAMAGLFDVIYSKSSFASDNIKSSFLTANPSLGEAAKTNKLLDYTTQISGPIIKNKLFYFVSAQRYERNDDPIGPRTRNDEASDRLNLKISYQATPNDNIVGSLQFDNYNIIGRSGFNTLTDTDDITNREDAPEYVWNTQWRHLFGSKTFTEVKYTGWWGYYDLNPEVNDSAHVDAATGLTTVSQGWHYYADRGRHDALASVSHYAEKFGRHDLKFGVEVERSKTRDRYGYANNTYYYDYAGAPYQAYSYGYDVTGRNHRESAYVQDSWKVNDRLTLNPGVRYDHVTGSHPDLGKVYSSGNLAPRFGFAFDLTGDHQTVLKGSYSQYYEGIFNDIYKRATPGIEDRIQYDVSACDPFPARCPASLRVETDRTTHPLYAIDPDIKHPRVDETSLGFERALGSDVRLSVTGMYRNSKNLIGSVNTDARWRPFTVTNALDQPMTLYAWTNRDDSAESLLITNPDGFQFLDPSGNVIGTVDAEKKYKSLMVVLSKRLSHRWHGQVSYVLAKAYGSVNNTSEGSFGNNSSTNGGGGSRQFETPNISIVNAKGELTNSRRHEFKALLGFQVPVVDVGINAYFRAFSGRPYTLYQQFGSSVLSFPPSSQGRRVLLEPRGSRRREAEKVLDLRLEKIFKLGGRKDRVSLYVDILNALNASTVDGLQYRVPTLAIGDSDVDFNSATSVVDPRQITLGARWSF
jgi:Carboxypeptidase regulatory-like domain/TonB dependent receptor